MALHSAVAGENVRLTRENHRLRKEVEELKEKHAMAVARGDILKATLRSVLAAFPSVLDQENNVSV